VSAANKSVLIAIGSNLGRSTELVHRAMDRLEALSERPLARSSLWRTTPVDCPPGSPEFVNAAVALVPKRGETPESLLVKLQALETEFGRSPKKVPNEARPLDLDMIAWGDRQINSKKLTLPHPRAHQRKFVLQPLSEIAPDFVLPGQKETIFKLLANVATGEVLLAVR
jgi:2-amino-4-hydroxy-6-hydroxymethyldihydropteridine diphosphokinase